MSPSEKRMRVGYYQSQGLVLEQALEAFDLTRHQYYYRPKGRYGGGGAFRPGCPPSTHTMRHTIDGQIIERPN